MEATTTFQRAAQASSVPGLWDFVPLDDGYGWPRQYPPKCGYLLARGTVPLDPENPQAVPYFDGDTDRSDAVYRAWWRPDELVIVEACHACGVRPAHYRDGDDEACCSDCLICQREQAELATALDADYDREHPFGPEFDDPNDVERPAAGEIP